MYHCDWFSKELIGCRQEEDKEGFWGNRELWGEKQSCQSGTGRKQEVQDGRGNAI
ncbi:hypothetical protein I79_026175 [Cricetulus griseus]|uniref:Uncharacterized protein n=1 Tax=Cricetulus griseus TaxID=10029 RepID=G3IQ77_CRIGR|nr:hypothetical protein I79_026175 [Cricetulus griseus]